MRKINFKSHDEALKKQLLKMHPYDLSLIYDTLDEDEKTRLFHVMDLKSASDLFAELSKEQQQDMFELLELNQKKQLLKSLESDDLKTFIESFENQDEQEKTLELLPKLKAKAIRLLLTYDENKAASIMSTEFITIPIDSTIKDATNEVITTSKDTDYLDSIFVVDSSKKMVGMIDLRELIIARPNQELSSIMTEDFQFVYDTDSIEDAIQTVTDYDKNVIPVLNHEGKILGIVTGDDIFDEIIEDVEYDYQKMALLSDHESSSSAIKRSKQRLPWLMIAVVLNLFNASLLSIFEGTLASITALVLFQPLILGMAGNIGTQALAVTILGFHLESFDDSKLPKKHIIKELTVGLFNSTTLALLSFGFVYGFLSLFPKGSQAPIEIAMIVFIAVISSMFVAASMGVFVPIIFSRLGKDPAVASGPIMTTINDLVALMIYFGMATLMFLS